MFRELTRKNKKLTEDACIRLLKTEKRGVLSVIGDGGYPYGMPMNHWYDEQSGKLYFHCGLSGHRLDALKKDDRVSFCVYDQGYRLPDQWPLHISSVIVFGRVAIVDDLETSEDVATKLSHKFTQDDAYIDKEIAQYAKRTLLLELTVEHMCGKAVEES